MVNARGLARGLAGRPSGAFLVARLDGCHSCGGVGPTKALKIHSTGGKQTVQDFAGQIRQVGEPNAAAVSGRFGAGRGQF